MKAATVWLVFCKEFVEALRDYRTIVPMVFVSAMMGPLLCLALPKIAISQTQSIIQNTYKIALIGQSELIKEEIDKQDLLKIIDIGSEAPQHAVDRGLVDAALLLPKNFDDAMVNNFAASQKIDIVYNGTRVKSSLARLFLDSWTHRLSNVVLKKRKEFLGIIIEPAPIVKATEITPDTPFGVASPILQTTLTCILMLMALLGVIYPALDAITGERERKTLEPLLMTHAERSELFAGKLLAVAFTSYISVSLTLAGFFAAQFFQAGLLGMSPTMQQTFPLAAVFPWPCFLLTLIVMLPLCFTFAAAALMFATYAKTIQQGQGYFLPLMLVALIPTPVVLLGDIHLTAAIAAVPFLNAIVAFNDILSGYINFLWLAVTAVVSLIFCFAVIWLASQLLAREDLLFGVEDSPARRFAANDYRRELFFLFVFVFLLMFYGSQVLVLNFHIWGVAMTQLFIVFLPALAFVHYWLRLPLSTVVNLSRPRGGFFSFVAVTLMAPMTISIASGFVFLQSKILPGTDTLNKVMSETLGIGNQPLWILVFVVGVLPGLCEEFLFRGVVLSLLPKRFSQAKLTIIVGTLFGAFHLSILRFVPTAALGALLTFVRLRAGSILPAMLLHCLHNSLSIVIAKYMTAEPSPWQYAGAMVSGLLGLWLFVSCTKKQI